MLAIIALICFVLSAFSIDLGGHDLTTIGLAFIAAHLAVGAQFAIPTWRRNP